MGRLAEALGKPSKSLQRMLGPRGNPTGESIFDISKPLQAAEQVRSQSGQPPVPGLTASDSATGSIASFLVRWSTRLSRHRFISRAISRAHTP
jgi:hypothetical protein